MLENSKHDLNLWQKLAAISKEIGHIEKTGKNQHFNYAFMEHAQVVATLRPIMDEYGVTIDFEAMDATWDEAKNTRVLLHMKYYVTNADKPSEHFERLWVSEAMDQQDKGINKALTAAEKNVFAKLFHLSDKDLEDDANDAPQTKQKAATQATRPPTTQNQPTPISRPVPAQSAPVAPRPAQATPAKSVTLSPGESPIKPPTRPLFPVEDDDNFKFYRAQIHAAKSLKELSDLGPTIKKQVVDGAVVAALREEFRKAESALTEKANAKIDNFVGAVK
jgi:hypothetical protein